MIKKYPLTTRVLHWLSALIVLSLFFSGWYMVDLDYYNPWYTRLPEWHIFIGLWLILFWAIIIYRAVFKTSIKFNHHHNKWEQTLSLWVKVLFYLLVFTMLVTGYLITTADGETYLLFEFLKIPAISQFNAQQIDILGDIHRYVSYTLMTLVGFHVLGALKHQLIDKDHTLKQML